MSESRYLESPAAYCSWLDLHEERAIVRVSWWYLILLAIVTAFVIHMAYIVAYTIYYEVDDYTTSAIVFAAIFALAYIKGRKYLGHVQFPGSAVFTIARSAVESPPPWTVHANDIQRIAAICVRSSSHRVSKGGFPSKSWQVILYTHNNEGIHKAVVFKAGGTKWASRRAADFARRLHHWMDRPDVDISIEC